ncbi:hypothetical protein PBV87_22540 [Niameybacter massiliensis]|uniref:Uncharacterized protein n=1 Tax=Holtiella tumoricola TaxID=3018743 RepID=A0AA42J398_9FIRM|nr:hypothetical protein [Holtiella tumoricola]MDA3734252.1 hypothetical protein [Holtiella tumoricola]
MHTYSTYELELDTIPLGAFWSTFSEEAPNRYEYQSILSKFQHSHS